MQLTASEKATLQFYQWEYLGRGYHKANEQVVIEPPFQPFVHKAYQDDQYQDDSRAPNILQRLGSLLSPPPKSKPEVLPELEIIPQLSELDNQLVGFSISFAKNQDISSKVNIEFLNMLAFSYSELTFEIYGHDNTIKIQIICSEEDSYRVESHLKAYFSTVIIYKIEANNLAFDTHQSIAIVDFGLDSEFMLPIQQAESYDIDPLTSIIAILEGIQQYDTVLLQIIFQGVTAPWSKHILNAVTDSQGESFFIDSPEFLEQSIEKVSTQLFSTVFRIAVQGNTEHRTKYLASELIQSVSRISASSHNQLIPLSNKDYDYQQHVINVFKRKSNRLGMLLNTKELAQFVHYPNKTVVSKKLGIQDQKTKRVSEVAIGQKYTLGVNQYHGIEIPVTIDDEARLRHMHIIGATGVGKSTLIAQMLLEDIRLGNGCALFDPHGDIVEDMLLRIPKYRQEDVIIVDPSDTEFPIGFNVLSAETEVEKIVLSSDIVATLKRYATAWGDTMTSVLSNAVNTFLESDKQGTLIELKRFLLESKFREQFLKSVEDTSLHYYWKHEYPMLKRGISPLLTRIDTFLRPKIIRYMMAKHNGLDFKECIEKKKIVFIKLSQGLIGEENSYLLGSLFLSKFNQAAQGRQALAKDQRHPYYVYLDEFQNFITPSITSILSGARKYGLGLILAHQELAQIDDAKVLNSVLSNPYTRLCFRLGHVDAKRLENGFSYFENEDLQSLEIGQGILRIGSSKTDCNITTFPLNPVDEKAVDIRDAIIANTRTKYTTPKAEVVRILEQLLPKQNKGNKENIVDVEVKKQEAVIVELVPKTKTAHDEKTSNTTSFEKHKAQFIERENKKTQERKHTNLQHFIKKVAHQRNYKVTLEHQTSNGGRVDVSLEKEDVAIAVEISVTNTLYYEVKNIQKCIDSGYNHVFMISENVVHLRNIKNRASETIDKKSLNIVEFLNPLELAKRLDEMNIQKLSTNKSVSVRGYRVKTNYSSKPNQENTKSSLSKIILDKLKSKE